MFLALFGVIILAEVFFMDEKSGGRGREVIPCDRYKEKVETAALPLRSLSRVPFSFYQHKKLESEALPLLYLNTVSPQLINVITKAGTQCKMVCAIITPQH